MNTLDRILAIPDKLERQAEMVSYAKSLGADPAASHQKEECNEEKLVLLIHDAQLKRKERHRYDLKFLAGGILVLAALIAVIGTVPKVFTAIFEKEENEALRQGKTMQAFDKEGKPIFEDNKPVLYKLMDGIYKEYDESKKVTYEFNYKMGALISKKTLDRSGKVIAHENYGDTAGKK